jgi:acyl-coenzyme A synthetase/AMP-(fatty) acid ligase
MLYTNFFVTSLENAVPDKVLLEADGKEIQAESLLNASMAMAIALQGKGVKKGDRVILAIKPDVQFLKIFYANMMIGTVMSIIDPEMGRDNYKAKLHQFDPQVAFVDSRLVLLSEHPIARWIINKLRPGLPYIPILRKCKVFTSGPWLPIVQQHHAVTKLSQVLAEPPELQELNEEEDFLVTYTSGTLNEPKGVLHSYATLRSSIQNLSELFLKNQDESISTHLPPFVLVGISSAIKVYLWDNDWSAGQKIDFISRNNITTLFGPPSDYLPLMAYCEEKGMQFPSSLKNIYLGSAPVYSAFLNDLLGYVGPKVRVISIYGMTENLTVAYADAKEKITREVDGDWVGTPFPGVKIKALEDGELALNSNQLFIRYWHLPNRQIPHHTGDLGVIDEDGSVVLQGRKKDMIIRRNFNIYPGLYEPTINKLKGITQAVMVGIYNDQKADEEIILVVEGKQDLDGQAILEKLKSGPYSIDKEAWPDRIVFMKLPRSGRQNKVNKNQLRGVIEQKRL